MLDLFNTFYYYGYPAITTVISVIITPAVIAPYVQPTALKIGRVYIR